MQCLSCQYDLRGQVDQRCPECGRPFLIKDESTYLTDKRRRSHGPMDWLKTSGTWLLRTLLVMLGLGSYLLIPSMTICRAYPNSGISQQNHNAILEEWKRQCGGALNCAFDKAVAKANMPVRISPIGDAAQLRARRIWERDLSERPMWFLIPCLTGFLLALTFKGQDRRLLLLIDFIVFAVVAGGCAGAKRLAEFRYRGSYAFLDDLEYLSPPFVRYSDRHGDYELVAYGPSPDHVNVRFVIMSSEFITSTLKEELDGQLNIAKQESR